jgi:hypothetical protein
MFLSLKKQLHFWVYGISSQQVLLYFLIFVIVKLHFFSMWMPLLSSPYIAKFHSINRKIWVVETIPGMGRRRNKGEWWRGWIQLWCIVKTLVNVTVYPQYNNNLKIYFSSSLKIACEIFHGNVNEFPNKQSILTLSNFI